MGGGIRFSNSFEQNQKINFTPRGVNVCLQWGSTEKHLGIVVGHTPLCQYHPAPTAADTVVHKQGDGLAACCVASPGALASLEYWSQRGALRLGEDVEKMRDASRELNRT